MLDLAVALRLLDVEPTLVCPPQGILARRGRAEGIPVFGLEKRFTVDPWVVRQLGRLWRTGACDLMHAHNGRMAFHAALARATVRRGTLVATQHFLTPARAERRGLARLAGQAVHRTTGRFISRHIAISRAVADAMLARQEVPLSKLQVVHNGIRDPQKLVLTSRQAVRRRWNIPECAPLVICLARLEPEKGLNTLIDAVEMVAHKLPAAVCLIAGRGSLESSLQAHIAAMASPTCVRLLGFVEDSPSLLAAADLFVLPSVAEPFGLSLVEAMALGIPVVSTRVGGPLEIVQEGRSGHLVPPEDPAALAVAMRSVLEDSVGAGIMGKAARMDFLEHFTADRMAREMLENYQQAKNGNDSVEDASG